MKVRHIFKGVTGSRSQYQNMVIILFPVLCICHNSLEKQRRLDKSNVKSIFLSQFLTFLWTGKSKHLRKTSWALPTTEGYMKMTTRAFIRFLLALLVAINIDNIIRGIMRKIFITFIKGQ